MPNGGIADVYVDGALDRTVDSFSDEVSEGPRSTKRMEAIWHKSKMEDGEHTIRMVIKGEPYPGASPGAHVMISDLIAFR